MIQAQKRSCTPELCAVYRAPLYNVPNWFWILRAAVCRCAERLSRRVKGVDNNSTRLVAGAGAFAHRVNFRTWMRLIDDC